MTSIIGGIIHLVLRGRRRAERRGTRHGWIQDATGLVGIWFIIAPWVLSFVNRPGEFWTSLVEGVS